jgi:hypothetical protein
MELSHRKVFILETIAILRQQKDCVGAENGHFCLFSTVFMPIQWMGQKKS